MPADPTPPSSPGAAQVIAQLRDLWRKMPRLARLGGIAAIAVVAGVIAWTSLSGGGATWVAVAPTLTDDDVADVAALLSERDIPYRITEEGKRVEVPTARVAEARRVTRAAGLPRGGVGLESFEHPPMTQTSFGEQVTYLRAIQGELQRSIEALAPIESARVHVAQGRRSVFRDAEVPPSASVALRVRAGTRLTPDQVRGVKQLVASSIDGLSADKVVVIDQHGEVLRSDDDGAAGRGADAAEREAVIGERVRRLLENVVGVGHVAVVVSVEMDRRRVTESEETFDPARSAIRSRSTTGMSPTPAGISGGIAGVQGNLPGAPAATGGAAGAAGGTGSETTNYEVGRTVRTIEEPEERIGRIHLAILVDHRRDASGALVPPPATELTELAQLARHAAGLDERRGDALELRSFPFAADEPVAPPLPGIEPAAWPLPVPLPIAGGAAAVLVVVIVVVAVLVLRRRRRVPSPLPVLALPAPLQDLERALADPAERSALPTLGNGDRSLEERVVGAVRSDLPRTARVLAAWLSDPSALAAGPSPALTATVHPAAAPVPAAATAHLTPPAPPSKTRDLAASKP